MSLSWLEEGALRDQRDCREDATAVEGCTACQHIQSDVTCEIPQYSTTLCDRHNTNLTVWVKIDNRERGT